MFPTSESSRKRSHASSVAGDGPASRTRSRSRLISSHVSNTSGPGAFPASSPPEQPLEAKVSGGVVTPPHDPFKAPSKGGPQGDPKGKAPELPTPTPTMPTIPTAAYDPRVENLTRQLTTLWHTYKGEHTRAERYKATAEEALDKVLLLQEELNYQHTVLRELSGRLNAQEPRDPSPEQPVIPGMAPNTSSAPPGQAPPLSQALYGTPLGAYQTHDTSSPSPVPGLEPPPVPPRPQPPFSPPHAAASRGALPFNEPPRHPFNHCPPGAYAPNQPLNHPFTGYGPPQPSTYNAYANWRPRGAHPNKPLKGESHSEYGPWRYAIDCKFEIDHPLYPNDRSRIRYALSQMEEPIFSVMQTLVQRAPEKALVDFLDNVEHYMGVHLRANAANPNTPEHDRVKKLKSTLIPSVGTALYIKDHLTVRSVLDDARKVDEGRLETFHYHPRGGPRNISTTKPTTTSTTPKPSGGAAPKNTTTTPGATTRVTTTLGASNPNTRFGPVAVKPEGWVGAWYEPQASPTRLTDEDRISLQQQGRCWGCRGSRHRSAHGVCLKQSSRPKQLNEITTKTIVESLEQAENV
ncbi:hypothetical protein BJX65DRAFT_315039 [Aspergillus insuetus]